MLEEIGDDSDEVETTDTVQKSEKDEYDNDHEGDDDSRGE